MHGTFVRGVYGIRRGPAALALAALLALGCDDGDADGEPSPDVGADVTPDAAPLDAQPPAVDMGPDPDLAPPDAAPPPDLGPDMAPDAAPPLGRFGRLDECIDRVLENSSATGAAVAVVEDGAVVHAAGLGHRNDLDETPVEPTTLFRFGSTLKGMTALAVLTEIEAGRLTPDTPVADVLPPLAEHADPRWQALTVHHLLTHQGGLSDYIDIQEPGDPDSVLGEVVESAEFAEAAYFMVDPGTFYNYSNPNFMLAGRVLEVLTDEAYRAAIGRLVFEPLGMQRTMFLPEDVLADGDYAAGVTAGGLPGTTRRVPADEYDSVWVRPAGMGWSSVLDLARYAQYIVDGTVPDAMDDFAAPVAPETWTIWRAAQVPAESFAVINEYAHGLLIHRGFRLGMDYYASDAVGHGGNIPGYTSVLLTVPEMGIGASVLANGDALNNPLEGCLSIALATSEHLPAPAAQPDNRPDPSTFADYVGDYVGGPNIGPMQIRQADDGGLDLTLPAVDDAGIPYDPRLVPIARDMFAMSIQGLQIPLSGIREAEGEPVRYLRTRYFVGARPADEPVEPVEPEEPMDPMEEGMQKRRPTVDVARLRRQLERAAVLAEPAPTTAHPLR